MAIDGVRDTSQNTGLVFTNKADRSQMDPSDFMNLLITQLTNQDFTNPMDDTAMVQQMSTFSNMQMMQEMAAYSKTSYAMSLVGKNVTASRYTTTGLDTTTGVVSKVSLVDNEYVVYVGGKRYELAQIMEIGSDASSDTDTDGDGQVDNKVSQVSPKNFHFGTRDNGITSTTAGFEWEIPTEDSTVAKGLKYTVYYTKYDSENPNSFESIEDVEKGTVWGAQNQQGLTSAEISGLQPETSYTANVVVTDSNGVKAVYAPVSFKTKQAA